MGTTTLALGLGLLGVIFLLGRDWLNGGAQAVSENWGGRVLWGLGITLLTWGLLFVYCIARQFPDAEREYRRVFKLLALNQTYVETDPEHIEIWCLLQFCRDVYDVELVVRVTTFMNIGKPLKNLIYKETLTKIYRDDRKRLRLGCLRVAKPMKPAIHSVWGSEVGSPSLASGQVRIMTDSRNLIEISVSPQSYRAYLEFVTPPPGSESAPFYLTDEDHSPWLRRLPND
jgi:hypothetical protein